MSFSKALRKILQSDIQNATCCSSATQHYVTVSALDLQRMHKGDIHKEIFACKGHCVKNLQAFKKPKFSFPVTNLGLTLVEV